MVNEGTTFNCVASWTILTVKSGKWVLKESFGIETAGNFPLGKSVCVRTHVRLFSVERKVNLIWDTDQHKQTKTLSSWVQFMYNVKVRTSNGAYFDASMRSSKHACIPGERRCSAVYCSHLFRQKGIFQLWEDVPGGFLGPSNTQIR